MLVVMGVGSAAVAAIVVFLAMQGVCRRAHEAHEAAVRLQIAAEAELRVLREQLADLNTRLGDAARQTDAAKEQVAEFRSRLAEANRSVAAAEETLKANETHYRKVLDETGARFKVMAQEVLEDRERKLKTEGTDQLKGIVDALSKDIGEFRKKVEASDLESAKNRTELKDKIGELVRQTNVVTEQANNLAGAIRGDAQLTGEWGEIQLKRVLDLAGFAEPNDYTYQETFKDDGTGRRSKRTDFVVKMPGNRALIIDSKNTIAAAERYHAAQTDDERRAAHDDIVASVRGHVDEIDFAEYQASVPNAFPTVLMYIPLEEIYLVAMKATIAVSGGRELLRDYARRKNVVFVNSTSVVPVVKLVEMMWNVERSEKNRQDTVRAAEELLLRANDFIKDFVAVGDAFRNVFVKYESAKALLVDAPGGRSISKAVATLVKLGTKPKTRGGKSYELAAPVAAEVAAEA